jgi:hypothetical protein
VAVIGKTSLRLYPFHTSSVPDRLLNTDPTAVVAPPTHSNKQIEVVTTLLKIMAAILVPTSTLKKTVNGISVLYAGYSSFTYYLTQLDKSGDWCTGVRSSGVAFLLVPTPCPSACGPASSY